MNFGYPLEIVRGWRHQTWSVHDLGRVRQVCGGARTYGGGLVPQGCVRQAVGAAVCGGPARYGGGAASMVAAWLGKYRERRSGGGQVWWGFG